MYNASKNKRWSSSYADSVYLFCIYYILFVVAYYQSCFNMCLKHSMVGIRKQESSLHDVSYLSILLGAIPILYIYCVYIMFYWWLHNINDIPRWVYSIIFRWNLESSQHDVYYLVFSKKVIKEDIYLIDFFIILVSRLCFIDRLQK